MSRIPHKIYINRQFVGIMNQPQVSINLLPGQYELTIQSMLPWFYATRNIIIPMGSNTTITFADREGWWDWLFGADIIISIIAIFISIPSPWNWVYQIVSNGYFIAWIIYEWSIRKRYFQFS